MKLSKAKTLHSAEDGDFAVLPQSFLVVCWAMLLAVLAVYVWHLSTLVYDSDVAILTSFARRMLDGHQFSQMYYETNPPLSLIIYVPVVWVQSISGLGIHGIHLVYTFCLGLGSFLASAYFLSRLQGVDRASRHLLMMGFVFIQIVVPATDFGDRDHLIVLALIPFTLGQIVLYQGVPVSRLGLWCVFIIGSVFILVKPHYGIVPSVLLAHRFFKGAYFRVIKDPDFIALALSVIAYGVILAVFFLDFLQIVLPDSALLYSASRNPSVWLDVCVYGGILAIFVPVLNTMPVLRERDKRVINILACLTFLLFIPYLVQGKALNYQCIPYLTLWFFTGMMASFYVLRAYMRPVLAYGLVFAVFVIIIGDLRAAPLESLKHKDFKTLPLSQALDKHCPQDRQCKFLLLSDTASNIHLLSEYHGAFHASRFTSMWYLPQLIMPAGTRHLNDDQVRQLTTKYRTMVADDLETMRPDVVIVLENLPGYGDFDFIDFYAAHPRFAAAFAQYKRQDTLEFDRRIYFPGVSTVLDTAPLGRYAVYVRE